MPTKSKSHPSTRTQPGNSSTTTNPMRPRANRNCPHKCAQKSQATKDCGAKTTSNETPHLVNKDTTKIDMPLATIYQYTHSHPGMKKKPYVYKQT